MATVTAWHWLADDGRMRDGRQAPADGEWLRHDGPVVMCQSGLHASRRALDALQYAPGSLVCRVECRDVVEEQDDKLVCQERRILWRVDMSKQLRVFARQCALDVVHLWAAPDVVVQYLETGDKDLMVASWDAATAAVKDVPWDAAMAAARAAAAAWDAAMAAAAARDAARAAAGDAARAAAISRQERRLVGMIHAAQRAA